MARYVIDDADVFDLFRTFSDFQLLQMRMERLLKHIAGLPNGNEDRHKDASYKEYVRSLYKTHFGCTLKQLDVPELKIIRVPEWEKGGKTYE
jgi:hypothetical protein